MRSRGPGPRLGRDRDWTAFARWCRARRLRALPAHPWTVAAYARWCEHRYPSAVIRQRVHAIARAHVLGCHRPPDRHPTVLRTLRMIETRQNTRADRAGLFHAEDFTEPTSARPPAKAKSAPAGRGRVMRTTPRLVRRRPVG